MVVDEDFNTEDKIGLVVDVVHLILDSFSAQVEAVEKDAGIGTPELNVDFLLGVLDLLDQKTNITTTKAELNKVQGLKKVRTCSLVSDEQVKV